MVDVRDCLEIGRKLVDIAHLLAPEHGLDQRSWEEHSKTEQDFIIEVVRKAIDDKIVVPGKHLYPKDPA